MFEGHAHLKGTFEGHVLRASKVSISPVMWEVSAERALKDIPGPGLKIWGTAAVGRQRVMTDVLFSYTVLCVGRTWMQACCQTVGLQ